MFPAVEVQAGTYAAQQAMSYLSGYESNVAALQQSAINLEQQTLGTISRVESSLLQEIQQFIQQSLFPSSTANSPSVQPASPEPGESGGQQSKSANLNDSSASEPTAMPIGEAVPIGETSPAGGTTPPTGSFSPSQIIQAYAFNQISFASYTGNTLPGAGQTIAIIGAYNDPDIASDLQTFDSYYGIAAPPSFTVLNENGGSTLPTGTNAGWAGEVSYDVEWAHAIAPGANILLVEANSPSWSDLMTAVTTASNQPGVSVVSMSWGGVESGLEASQVSSYDSDFTTPSGHTGVTFVAATGDVPISGSEPEYPSTSPNVLAVGGTELTTDTSGDYESEEGWSGSVGGISVYEPLPSYQPGTYQNGSTEYTSTMRMVPDVSLNAVNSDVYDSFSGGGWQSFAGTSAAAPIWAALIAIADQGRALDGEGTLVGATQTLPAIYQMPSTNFHDITTGNNGTYSAGPGYDLVTGLGTPIANLVINSLVSYDASSWQPVSLSSYYNETGISDGSAFSGTGLDGSGYELGTPGNIGWRGYLIPYGPVNAPDVVSAEGQAVDLQAGAYTDLTIFATAIGSDQLNQPFKVEYTNGTTQTFTLSLSNWTTQPGQYSDEIGADELSQYNSSGTKTGTTVYDSGYALPLITSLTVKSITLPDNPAIIILGMGLYHDASTPQAVSLSTSYNMVGISDGTPFSGTGLSGSGYELGTPGNLSWQGTLIPYGPTNADDVVNAQGQAVNLSASADYSLLTIFATAVGSDQTNQPFKVEYTNGTTQTFTLSLSNWTTVPGQYSDEIRADVLSQYSSSGTKTSTTVYDSGYALPLITDMTVKSITLPDDSDIDVVGMLLS
ncbi:MAG TPA: S53 family peptidase [Gemmataceae bacterium]|nr:S53 family peptidase [Gemmataceae bacterium]